MTEVSLIRDPSPTGQQNPPYIARCPTYFRESGDRLGLPMNFHSGQDKKRKLSEIKEAIFAEMLGRITTQRLFQYSLRLHFYLSSIWSDLICVV
jgi:hypothetical protein